MDTPELRAIFRQDLPRAADAPDEVARLAALRALFTEHPDAAGFTGDALPVRTAEELAAMPPFVLLAWVHDAQGAVYWYAVPQSEAADLADDLDLVDGLCFASAPDCAEGQWRAALRIAAVIGTAFESDTAAEMDGWLVGDDDEPSVEELEELWERWRPSEARAAAHFDRRFVRVVAVNRAM